VCLCILLRGVTKAIVIITQLCCVYPCTNRCPGFAYFACKYHPLNRPICSAQQWRRRPTSGMDYSDISINSTQKTKLARLQHVNSICRGKVGVEEGEGAGHTAHMHAAPTTSKVDHAHKSNHRRSETSARSCSR
jgi:hypothetical protein